MNDSFKPEEQGKVKELENVIKSLKEGYGRERCENYSFGCPNCFGQMLIDMLEDELRNQKDENM